MSLFYVSESNPNDTVGGGGCVMSGEAKSEDCAGPFIIFTATTTDSAISPHTVLCAKCLATVSAAIAEPTESEVIEVPEDDVVEVPLI